MLVNKLVTLMARKRGKRLKPYSTNFLNVSSIEIDNKLKLHQPIEKHKIRDSTVKDAVPYDITFLSVLIISLLVQILLPSLNKSVLHISSAKMSHAHIISMEHTTTTTWQRFT